MKYLLDTCAWLDALLAPEKLSLQAREVFSSPERLTLSSISLIEFSRKAAYPRATEDDIILSVDPEKFLAHIALPPEKIKIQPITASIALAAYRLPDNLTFRGKPHKDPADLIIIATARLHGFTVLTSDRVLLDYPHLNTLNSRG